MKAGKSVRSSWSSSWSKHLVPYTIDLQRLKSAPYLGPMGIHGRGKTKLYYEVNIQIRRDFFNLKLF